jgi:hypothetical protein
MYSVIKSSEVSKIKEAAHKNQTAEAVFTALALRDRMRHTTDLNRFKTQLVKESGNIVEQDYLATFKELEKLGMGSIVYGRKKKPSKFKWHYNLKDIGHAAMGDTPQQSEPASAPIKRINVKSEGLNLCLKKNGSEINLAFQNEQQLVGFVKQILE